MLLCHTNIIKNIIKIINYRGGSFMAQLPGIDLPLIRLNPEWSVENASSTALEQNLSINDFSGKRLIITLPGAGGFCNKELDQVKESMDAFLVSGVEEVIVIVGNGYSK